MIVEGFVNLVHTVSRSRTSWITAVWKPVDNLKVVDEVVAQVVAAVVMAVEDLEVVVVECV